MHSILVGPTHARHLRIVAVEGVDPKRTRTEYRVQADLSLIRRYGIPIQELPLLCRGVLDQRAESVNGRTLTFTEADMRLYAAARSATPRSGRSAGTSTNRARVLPAGQTQAPQEDDCANTRTV
jgi:hypothetical protein